MQTRPLPLGRRTRHKQQCPFCPLRFTHYNEVYIHAICLHKQVIDATYTCGICQTVCRNAKGLRGHKGRVHNKGALAARQSKEETASCPSPLCLVPCPVCMQAYSKEETEEHIGVHDSEVGKTYCEMPSAAKLLIAEVMMKAKLKE